MRGPVVGLVAALFASKCQRSPPRVDFESGVRPEPPRATVDVPAVDVPGFAVVTSAQVPGEGRTLTVGGLTLAAEPAERFVASLALPPAGGASEAWVYRVGAAGEALDLLRVIVEGGALRREVIAGTAPSVAGCSSASLRATSPRSVVVTARCGARAESRWVARGDAPRARSTVVVEPTATGVADVTADVTAEDRDADGVDELRVAIRRTDATRGPSARLVYFDRGGRLARDVSALSQSLTEAVQAAQRSASGSATASAAMEAEATIALIRRSLCTEEGAPRVVVDGVRGATCGDAAGPGPRGTVRVTALATLGEVPAAEQLARALAAAPGLGGLWGSLEGVINRVKVVDRGWRARPGPFAGMALDASAPGRAGSLAFDLPLRPPALMVRGLQSGRVDLASLSFVPGNPGAPRDLLATVPGGVVVGVAARCDGTALLLCDPSQACEPVAASVTTAPAAVTPWFVHHAPSADLACAPDPSAMRALGPPSTQVMGAVRDRVLVSLDGRLWWVGAAQATPVPMSQRLGPGFSPGGPVSVNGAWAVLPGLNGLWVRGATGWKLRPVEGLEGRTAQLRDLVVTDDGAVIAGLVGTQVYVIERRPAR